ncbi:biopolymer transport protein, ExbB/TolQ family [Deferribacter desulfuricans SSM1]|uniref:Biopolymer transport protein, ExbB/TolQ family n=1 Tax=Deferribacter desulfuricans (strain DSM 14783 / JCM 11476 / NBRC 101012 / SSM1) TaxID=639282 RepID=D3PDQ9_DEFDS|nr:MotA/TolQ/ExbB proton channel family protein [Deferribacter desulfuricans]BAI80732.1 biopolymer transport protein, ExbB/TolQ family [Deferribacter desulfuricans SSM1]
MFEIIQKGGVLMYPIIALSVISLAVFLERLFTLRKNNFVPSTFMEKLYIYLEKKDFEDAKNLCELQKNPMSEIAYEILNNLDLPVTRLMELAEETGRFQASKLERFLPTLQTIGNIAPLLGLLGTVLGMIKTFIVISEQGVGNAQALAGGISEALLTTAAGLSVAIPTVLFYHIVRHRSEKLTLEMEKATAKVINLIFKEG